MNSIPEIESAMADVISRPAYQAVMQEYERLLAIMGNVDGNEIISLIWVAIEAKAA